MIDGASQASPAAGTSMPILGYFVWVGACLLGLLFFADSYVPKLPEATTVQHTYNIPIKSATPPGQQAVTFSGETRDFGAPPPMTVVDFASPPNASKTAATAPTHAHAELTAAPPSPSAQSKPVRQKVAKRKINRSRELDVARLPDGWRRDDMRDGWRRDGSMGLAFANPFFR
jgi:hypothetical protein